MQWFDPVLTVVTDMAKKPVVMLLGKLTELREYIFCGAEYLNCPCCCEAFNGLVVGMVLMII